MENSPTDYNKIGLNWRQLLQGIAEGLGWTAGIAFLFYRSPIAMLLAGIFLPVHLKRKRQAYIRECKNRLQQQFKSGMQIVSGALAAGYSMENAWKNAEKDVGRLYGNDSEFYRELSFMNQKVRMNEPLEQILYDFAIRSGSEDICNFAEIFRHARKNGGNVTEIIRTTISRMQEKADIMAEIENAVASRRAEQKLMNAMLPGILLFITLGSPEYTSALYHTLPGVLAMSICLAGYLFACRWSEKLTDISV